LDVEGVVGIAGDQVGGGENRGGKLRADRNRCTINNINSVVGVERDIVRGQECIPRGADLHAVVNVSPDHVALIGAGAADGRSHGGAQEDPGPVVVQAEPGSGNAIRASILVRADVVAQDLVVVGLDDGHAMI